MTVYILTIVLLLYLYYVEVNVTMSSALKRTLLILAYAVLVLQIGLRWEIGTDWDAYFEHFEAVSDFSSAAPSLTSPEYGYNVCVWLTKLLVPNYSVFLVLHAVIYYLLIFNSIQRYTGMLYLPLMVFYAETMGVMGSNRQLIAVAIGLFALRYIESGQRTRFLLLVGLAFMFHSSALLLLLFLFLRASFRSSTIFLALAGAIVFGLSPLPEMLFSEAGNLLGGALVAKAAYYLAAGQTSIGESGLTVIGLVKRIVFLALFLHNRAYLSSRLRYYNLMFNGYVVGLVFYFACARSLLIVVNRGSLYFDILEPILLTSHVMLLTRKANRMALATALCVASVVFFFQSIAPYPSEFIPYRDVLTALRF
jgi:hypothetical protein